MDKNRDEEVFPKKKQVSSMVSALSGIMKEVWDLNEELLEMRELLWEVYSALQMKLREETKK